MNGLTTVPLRTAAVVLLALAAGCARAPRPESPISAGAVVALDPGHPSENGTGARGASGLSEHHVTWDIAEKLRPMLEDRGIRVVMTRTGREEKVSNRRRAEIANESGAALLLRLHCDARKAPGTGTYYPDRQGTTTDGVTGPAAGVIASSEAAARAFHPAMIAAMGPGWADYGILGDSKTAIGGRQGALTGSIFSRVPALTIEMVSLANAQDEAFIATDDGKARMARALAAGVEAYLRSPAARR